MSGRTLFCSAMWVVVLLAGCGERSRPALRDEGRVDQVSPVAVALVSALEDFEEYFDAVVADAASEIEWQAPDREMRKAAVLWKVRMTTECRVATNQPDPAAALIDTWTLCTRMRAYMADGLGKDLFGELQPIAVDAARQLEDRIAHIAETYLPADKFVAAREAVEGYAMEHPIGGVFDRKRAPRMSKEKEGQTLLEMMMTPLEPFRAIGQFNRGADSLRDMSLTADRFADIVEDLPSSVRWQTQLLLMNLEEAEAIRSTLNSMETFSQSTRRIADTAEALPKELREEASAWLDEVEARQGTVQETLSEARETAASIERSVGRVDEIAQRVDRTVNESSEVAGAWRQTAEAVRLAVAEMNRLKGEDAQEVDGDGESGGFDVRQYGQTAGEIQSAATELRQLVGDIHALAGSPVLPQSVATIDARAQATLGDAMLGLRGVVDHLAWRLGQLALLVFVLAVVYRWTGRRWTSSMEA